MQIAGGFYREQCCIPAWDAMLGSGVRAAMSVTTLSTKSCLHTYSEDCNNDTVDSLKKQGVELQISQRPTGVVFSYFHPLSRPHICPSPNEIIRQPPINVMGDAVLRFGFLEGEAIVEANRAVYDPQTWRSPAPFGANGSRANELAIVLNELELRSMTGQVDISLAANQLINEQRAEVVVVKRGIWGASVYDRSGSVTQIPVYRSSRIFKIGTGDVFSAIFTHFWAENKFHSADSADLASRSVAQYCDTGHLPIAIEGLAKRKPICCKASATVLLLGETGSLGQRYTMEEAHFVLEELGVEVCCPALGDELCCSASVAIILLEGATSNTFKMINYALTPDIPIVVLREKGVSCDNRLNDSSLMIASIVDDFATAMYVATWNALEIKS